MMIHQLKIRTKIFHFREVLYMEEIRKAVRTTTDTSLDGKRVFDVLVSQKSVELEVKMGKQKFVRIPWRSVVDQVENAKIAYESNKLG